jgi:hypothetical protein
MERQLRRRRRPALSCLQCRRRKIKCDRNDPCRHCVSAKTQCAYKVYSNEPVVQHQSQLDSSENSRSNPLAYVPPSLVQDQRTRANTPIIEHDDSLSELPPLAAASVAELTGLSIPIGRSSIQPTHGARNTEPDLLNILQRVERLEAASLPYPIHGTSETGHDVLVRQCGLQDSQIFLNKTRILRWSHWIGTGKEVWPSSMFAFYFDANYFSSLRQSWLAILRLAETARATHFKVLKPKTWLSRSVISFKNAKIQQGVSRWEGFADASRALSLTFHPCLVR